MLRGNWLKQRLILLFRPNEAFVVREASLTSGMPFPVAAGMQFVSALRYLLA